MIPDYLEHVTLQTAHARRSPRSEVGPGVTDQLRPLLERALKGEHAPVGPPGYTITAAAEGRCCTVTLWRVVPETRGPERVPVLTTGIAGHSRCGAHLWRLLHDGADVYATDPEQQPSAPWCADRIEAAMALEPEASGWTGDFARCIAWSFIELRAEGPLDDG